MHLKEGKRAPTSKIPGVVRRRPILLRADLVISSTGRSCGKAAGVLSKVLRLGVVLEVRSMPSSNDYYHTRHAQSMDTSEDQALESTLLSILLGALSARSWYSKSCKCCCSFAIQTICWKIGKKEIDRARNGHCQENKENATQNGILP